MPLAPTDFIFSDDQALIVRTAAEFARTELLPLDRACDVDESCVTAILPKLSEMGFLNLLVPEELGGVGCPYRTFAAIIHELSVWSPSVGVTVAVHSLVGGIVARFVGEPLRSRWLSAWGDPRSFAAFAISEADAGSDASGVKTTAVEVDGGFRINGEKMWVTNGLSAGWLFTLVRLAGLPLDKNYCTLMIDARLPGITRTKIHGKMGIRGSETAVVHFSDVFVPVDHLVGERGNGLETCLASLNQGRIGIAAQATGIGEACLTEMVAYARQREQFGQPIGSFQGIGEQIADSAVELEAAKALVWRAACAVDSGETNRSASSMAKLYASEAANRIAYRAVQVHGGAGYVRECRVEQLYRDARITSIYEGTSEIQRIVIARELAKP
ncbi:MAG: acyl-CoA dehydrogenase family protein [Planctomycetota bacterium]